MAWYANIVSNTTSRISNLRSTLLGGDADGDTEDDTNVCRVLRAYYTEKGRAFPQWLPPDPKAPPAPVATPVSNVGSRYGGGNLAPSASAGSSGGLSSLWDKPSSPAPAVAVQNSLRPRASPFQNRGGLGGPPGADQSRYSDASQQDYSGGSRPLPSQRLGSYQSTHSAPPAASTAQDKLRGLFSSGGGGSGTANTGPPSRTGSPAYGGGPAAGGGGGKYGGGANAYGSRGGYNGGGGGAGGGGAGGGRPGGLPGGPRRPVGSGLPSGPRMR